MRARFKRRPSASMVVAATALFVALGTGAYAASHLPKNSVGSNAIKKGGVKTRNYQKGSILGRFIGDSQVKTSSIHNGAITSAKASFISSNTQSSSVSTTSSAPVDLGGPTVTVTVPEGGVVELFAQADISVSGGGTPTGKVDLVEPALVPNATGIMASASNTFQTRRSSPGSADFNGVINATRAGWITLVPPAGTYTFGLRYETSSGTATFQNRTLLASVIH